jgi:replicative DNA helicase
MSDDLPRWAWSPGSATITVDFRNLPNEPRTPAAESATLGALMLSSQCASRLIPILKPDHFTSRPHQDTFRAIDAVNAEGKPVDPLLVNDELRKQGRICWGELKASVFIHACLEATYLPGHGVSYAALVIECAAQRRVLQAGVRIAQAAARRTGDLPDLMKFVAAEVRDTADCVSSLGSIDGAVRAPVRLGTLLDDFRRQPEAIAPAIDISE